MSKNVFARSAAAGILAILAGAAMAAPASAATVVGNATYYTAADFGTETTSYPAGVDWFWGDTGAPGANITFGVSGLVIDTAAGQKVQMLNQAVPSTYASATALIDYITSTVVYDDAGSSWAFQVPLFGNGVAGDEFTTLRPTAANTTDDAVNWITSWPIYDDGGAQVYAAGASDTLTNLVTALFGTTTAPEVLAMGLWVGDGGDATIHGIGFGRDTGDLVQSVFLPQATRTLTPATITPASTVSPGLTFSGTGWAPGARLYLEVYECTSGDNIATGPIQFADGAGAVSATIQLTTELEPGTYCYYFDDDSLLFEFDILPEAQFTVANVLAETGVDMRGTGIAIAAFLVLGAGMVAFTRLRREA